MNDLKLADIQWVKMQGLIPAVIQDSQSGTVLMLGYMNEDALNTTLELKELTLFSRSKQRLWRKGETSGNTMRVVNINLDCDGDSLLVQVQPAGPACHLGLKTCFQPEYTTNFLYELCEIIDERARLQPENSYCSELMASGVERCAQKVGEEAVETVIAAVSRQRDELISESADLLFHLLVLLRVCDVGLGDVVEVLRTRR